MERNDTIKNTIEWKALNRIWKNCSPEQQKILHSDFETVATFIRKNIVLANRHASHDNFKYLNALSNEAKQFVITLVTHGEINLYHSFMAVLENKPTLSIEELSAYYFDKFSPARPYLLENHDLINEVLELCWNRFHGAKK